MTTNTLATIEAEFEVPASSYTIQMGEAQRAALLALIQELPMSHPARSDPEHELFFWEDMLKDLPENEREQPKTLHGFCL